MGQPVVITKVPNARVPIVKAEFEHEGATVSVTDNADGTSTVTATYPASTAAIAAGNSASAAAVVAKNNLIAHIVTVQ